MHLSSLRPGLQSAATAKVKAAVVDTEANPTADERFQFP
jgi:hypothetical protein